MDLSKLSEEELERLAGGGETSASSALDLAAMSDDELMLIAGEAPQRTKLESGARGLAQGASLGFADEITGALESAFTDKTYQQARDESRKNYALAQAANPATYGVSEIAGTVGTSLIPGIGAGGTLTKAVLAGAGAGGLSGLGTSTADLSKGEFGQAASDTLEGAAIGATLGGGGYGASKALKALPRFVDDIATSQSARAQGAERSTFKKLGPDKIKEIGRYGLDEGIVTPLASTDEMIARNEASLARGGAMMDEVYSTIDNAGASTFNPLDEAVKIDQEIGDFYRSPINRSETNVFENTIESVLMRGDKPIPLREAQILKEEIKKVANWKNPNPSPREQVARSAYLSINKSIDDAAEAGSEAVGIVGLKDKLQRGKKLWGSGKGSEALLENKQAAEQGNRMFGLTDMITGGASLGYGGATGDWQTAVGIVGAKKGFDKYGNKILAVGANKLGDVLKKAPQLFGKYAPVLQAAEQRGPQGLASTHFILSQTRPDYRQTLQKVAGLNEEE